MTPPAFTIDRGKGREVLVYGPFTDGAGTRHPVAVLDLWPDNELAAIGVRRGPLRRRKAKAAG